MFSRPSKSNSAVHTQKLKLTIAAAAVSAFMLSTPAVWAQTTTRQSGSTAVLKPAPSANSAGKMAGDDMDMVEDLAEASLAWIENGKLALENSQNAQVKKFAQQMIDDHTKALKDLQQVAQTKGATLPTEPDLMQKSKDTALKAVRQYV